MRPARPALVSGAALRPAAQAEAERVEQSWGSLTWLAGADCGNAGGLTLGRVIIRAGQANPRHCHPNCEEALYLLRGRLDHSVGDATVRLEPGDTLVISPGVYHHAVVLGEQEAEMMVAYSSADRQFVLES